MATSIALVSSKGGSGKTTTALNLAVTFAERGARTLLVDLDPQGAIGLSLARSDTDWRGLAEVVGSNAPLADAIVQTKLPSLSILPRGRLDPVDCSEFERALLSSLTLRRLSVELGEGYAYILFDTPSGLGVLTKAALQASLFALMPVQAEPLALRSITQALRVIDYVRREHNPSLSLLGILPTMVRISNHPSLKVMNTLWSDVGGVLETYFPRSDALLDASDAGLPLAFLGGKPRPELRRFEALADELEGLMAAQGLVGDVPERAQRELL